MIVTMPLELSSIDLQNQLINQASTLLSQGQFRQARILLKPYAEQSPGLNLLLGIACAGDGAPKQAARRLCFVEQQIKMQRHPCCKIEQFLGPLGLRNKAIPVFKAALKITPDNPRLLSTYGELLTHLGKFADAIHYIRRSLKIEPNSYFSMNQLAIALHESGQLKMAKKIYDRLLEQHPDNFSIYSNLASYYTAIGDMDEALSNYRKAILLNPNFAPLRVNYSIALLKAGYYHQGWIEHEWRFNTPNHTSLPQSSLIPILSPNMDIKGKKILVTQEEGYGDTLMYLRYVTPLIKRGAIVELWVAETMEGLCQRIEGKPLVKVGGEEPPPFDWHCPFISLPKALGATPSTGGMSVPYLTADPVKVAEWKKKLPKTNKLKVGVVWGGNPRPEDMGANMTDRKRSMSFTRLLPLRKLKDICFINLQMGPYADQLDEANDLFPIFNPMKEVKNMEDTAAIIMNLDVILSVDTVIVHLAGGLGKPVLMMDRYDNCWRWLTKREDSPWYPKMHIIRQTEPRIWGDVVKRAAVLLNQMAKEHKARKSFSIFNKKAK